MLKSWFFWLIIIIIAGGGFFIYKEANKPKEAEAAPGEVLPDLGRSHVDDISNVKYNSNPPTSGDHFIVWAKPGIYKAPVSDGYLIHSLEHGYVVISYNCEKSISSVNFLISKSYAHEEGASPSAIMSKLQKIDKNNSTFTSENAPYELNALSDSFQSEKCQDLVSKLSEFSKKYRRVIIIPHPGMDHLIALTAWNHRLFEDKWDEKLSAKFVEALENQGPEKTME